MADTAQGGANTSNTASLTRDYIKGNWTVSETMILIEAKKMDDERRMKRSTGNESEGGVRINKPAELRWKWVEDYCWRRGCMRSQNQCNDKWDNLMRDYKKVRDYERKIVLAMSEAGSGITTTSSQDQSYWKLEKNERKEKNLPTNMLPQIYEALVEVVERKGSTTPRVSGGITGISFPPLSSTSPTTAVVPCNVVERTKVSAGAGAGAGAGSVIDQQQQQQQAPLMASPALLQHHISPLPIAALPLPTPASAAPSPIQAQPLPHSQPILPTMCDSSDSDTSENPSSSHSPAKRRRKDQDKQQGTQAQAQAQVQAGTTSASARSTSTRSSTHEVASAISKSASIIAEALLASEEREERRHRDLLNLHERRLKIEESKNEINRQGINGFVDAINNLANSIQALASDKHAQSTSKPS